MTPEQEQKLNEIYDFMQALKQSNSIPFEFDSAVRERYFNSQLLEALDLPTKLTAAPRAAITEPSGGATIDSQARTAIVSIITELEELGLITEN